MDLAMAVGMKESEIVEPVTATVDPPDDMVSVPVGFNGNWLVTDGTSGFLSPPERPRSAREGYLHAALVALLEV